MSQTVNKKSVNSMRRKTQISTAKNRKDMKRPQIQRTTKTMASSTAGTMRTQSMIERKERVTIAPVVHETSTTQTSAQPYNGGRAAIDMFVVKDRMKKQAEAMPVFKARTASEIKEEAIEKAMKFSVQEETTETKQEKKFKKMNLTGVKRFLLALACASAAVFAVAYFVNINSPNIALKVAAIQNGINATYPAYTPRGYELANITSENGKITLNFRNPDEEGAYMLVEEKSSWDSNSLFTNYVKDNYHDDYSTIKEQGLTIYIDNKEACWVNGGVLYKLKVISGDLTKKQITTIATTR